MQTLDKVASVFINVMVPGQRTTYLTMGDNTMLLKKDEAEHMVNQTFTLPLLPGVDKGIIVSVAMQHLVTPDNVLGIAVSNLKLYSAIRNIKY